MSNKENLLPDDILDTTGLICPEPVMLLHNKIRDLKPSQLVKVIATDPSSKRDIPKFCNFLGHQLLKQQEDGTSFYYWIQKKPDE